MTRWGNTCFCLSYFRLVEPKGDPFIAAVARFPLQRPDYIFWLAFLWDSAISKDNCSLGILFGCIMLLCMSCFVVVSLSWMCPISLCILSIYIFRASNKIGFLALLVCSQSFLALIHCLNLFIWNAVDPYINSSIVGYTMGVQSNVIVT
jgi:hypothetical protein